MTVNSTTELQIDNGCMEIMDRIYSKKYKTRFLRRWLLHAHNSLIDVAFRFLKVAQVFTEHSHIIKRSSIGMNLPRLISLELPCPTE
jgi:hypothetical protein